MANVATVVAHDRAGMLKLSLLGRLSLLLLRYIGVLSVTISQRVGLQGGLETLLLLLLTISITVTRVVVVVPVLAIISPSTASSSSVTTTSPIALAFLFLCQLDSFLIIRIVMLSYKKEANKTQELWKIMGFTTRMHGSKIACGPPPSLTGNLDHLQPFSHDFVRFN